MPPLFLLHCFRYLLMNTRLIYLDVSANKREFVFSKTLQTVSSLKILVAFSISEISTDDVYYGLVRCIFSIFTTTPYIIREK